MGESYPFTSFRESWQDTSVAVSTNVSRDVCGNFVLSPPLFYSPVLPSSFSSSSTLFYFSCIHPHRLHFWISLSSRLCGAAFLSLWFLWVHTSDTSKIPSNSQRSLQQSPELSHPLSHCCIP